MIFFINSIDYWQAINTYCSLNELTLDEAIDSQGARPTILNSWNELVEIEETSSLFDDSTSKISFYDIASMQIDSQVMSSLSPDNNIYLYSSARKILSSEKKIMEKQSIIVVDGEKIDLKSKLLFIQKYVTKNELNISNREIDEVSNMSTSMDEIIDILDFLLLSETPSAALKSIQTKAQTPLYVLPLRENNIGNDLKPWLTYLNSDTNQLMLSLIFTKTEKYRSKHSSIIMSEIIKTDTSIKSQSRISPVLSIKLLFWKIQNKQMYEI